MNKEILITNYNPKKLKEARELAGLTYDYFENDDAVDVEQLKMHENNDPVTPIDIFLIAYLFILYQEIAWDKGSEFKLSLTKDILSSHPNGLNYQEFIANHNNYKGMPLKTISKVFDKNQEIPLIDEVGWSILSKLSNRARIKDYSYIRNKRGELDLTKYKDCILKGIKTDHRLVRGNMISEDGVVDKNDEFVSIDRFVNKKSKEFIENDFNKSRLICQQISNVDLKKRLKFSFSEPKDILANSCNYINSLRSFDDLMKLHLLLNSALLNWRFKVTSSNNHINNYEIAELPILNLEQLDLSIFKNNKYENEVLICELYGLNEIETNYILNKVSNIKSKEIKLLDEVI